jgi:hypothetical protein
LLGDKLKNGSASSRTSITVNQASDKSKEISTTVKKTGAVDGSVTLNLGGSSGNKTVSINTSKSTGKSSDSGEVSVSKTETKSSIKSSNGTKTVSDKSGEGNTVSKQKSQTTDGNVSSKLSSGKGTTGSSASKKSSGSKVASSDSGEIGKKTVTSIKQESQTVDGSVSIKLGLGNKTPSSKDSNKSSSNKTVNASSGQSGTKTVTSTKQKSQTVDGSVSIKLNLGSGASDSNGSKKPSGNKTADSSKTGNKTVTSTKGQSQTVGGSVSIKLNQDNGKSDANGPNKSTENKPVKTDSDKSSTKATSSGNEKSDSKGPSKSPVNKTVNASPDKKDVGSAQKQPVQSKPSGTSKSSNVVINARKQSSTKSRKGGSSRNSQSDATVAPDKNGESTVNKGTNRKNKITLQSLVRTNGQSSGKKVVKLPRTGESVFFGESYDVTDQESYDVTDQEYYGVTDQESNAVRDITIDSIPSEYTDTNIDVSALNGLLAYLLYGRGVPRVSSSQSQSSGCTPQDTYVNYVYEYDIQNQVFNSSFQDPNSVVVQRLQSDIADWTAEEIYKRNLASYVTDDARLTKIIDVSKQYNNRATLRLYISINVNKNLIPVIRRVLETVGNKLQNERFATSNKNIDWGDMVLIPIEK